MAGVSSAGYIKWQQIQVVIVNSSRKKTTMSREEKLWNAHQVESANTMEVIEMLFHSLVPQGNNQHKN